MQGLFQSTMHIGHEPFGNIGDRNHSLKTVTAARINMQLSSDACGDQPAGIINTFLGKQVQIANGNKGGRKPLQVSSPEDRGIAGNILASGLTPRYERQPMRLLFLVHRMVSGKTSLRVHIRIVKHRKHEKLKMDFDLSTITSQKG